VLSPVLKCIFLVNTFVDVLVLIRFSHELLEIFINCVKVLCFFTQFALDFVGGEDVFKINPIFLHCEHVINGFLAVQHSLLEFFYFFSEFLEIS
jgi:hypothetical protein